MQHIHQNPSLSETQTLSLDARSVLDRHGLKGSVSELLQWLVLGSERVYDSIYLGGRGSPVLFGLGRSALEWGEVLAAQFGHDAVASRWPHAACGLVGILSYDDLARLSYRESIEVRREFKPGLSKVWAVPAGLQIDAGRQAIFGVWPSHLRAASLARIDDLLDGAVAHAVRDSGQKNLPQDWADWQPACSAEVTDDGYLEKAAKVIELIRDGRFYQLNLLRFFELSGCAPQGWPGNRIEKVGGSWSAMIDVDDGVRVTSFSPEQFVSISGERIETFPVKGTIARDADPDRDAANARRLLESTKDLAELHMIVDLMRNDFHRICLQGSVAVPVAQEVRSHANVHHLHAHVTGKLKPGIDLAGLIGAICPAGSITGAPKLEVIKSIDGLEGRARGYHMGHAFHWRFDGSFDSSVLIRTMANKSNGTFELAVGSGIVVHSDPAAEMAEITAKARVATSPVKRLN